ncbi:hypothetical protein K488DRAFT_81470 [Vararia minispora EC-137]|uniref:Uncharacterized protein n=1 Tax=Vararia minispora EC-137 TaxID=1314806 RepID=A0ACB8R016_9AGAM|nr:hypothetical protein K488DRAFT_81470 [Vararia minispora EC-137]
MAPRLQQRRRARLLSHGRTRVRAPTLAPRQSPTESLTSDISSRSSGGSSASSASPVTSGTLTATEQSSTRLSTTDSPSRTPSTSTSPSLSNLTSTTPTSTTRTPPVPLSTSASSSNVPRTSTSVASSDSFTSTFTPSSSSSTIRRRHALRSLISSIVLPPVGIIFILTGIPVVLFTASIVVLAADVIFPLYIILHITFGVVHHQHFSVFLCILCRVIFLFLFLCRVIVRIIFRVLDGFLHGVWFKLFVDYRISVARLEFHPLIPIQNGLYVPIVHRQRFRFNNLEFRTANVFSTFSSASSSAAATGTLAPGSGTNAFANNPGALAGLIVGVTVAVGLLALLAYFFIHRRFAVRRGPSPGPAVRQRRPLDEEEMDDNALQPVSHRVYAGVSPRSHDELLGDPESDPDAPTSLGHSQSLSHGGHSLMGGGVGFAPMAVFPVDNPDTEQPGRSSSGHGQELSSSVHEHSSHGHDAAASSSSHSAAWFQADELVPPKRPSLHHDSSGSGSGTGSQGTGSGSGSSSQPLFARSPAPPTSYQSPGSASPTSSARKFTLPWIPGSRAQSVYSRRRSSVIGSGDVPTFFESTPRPRSPPPSFIVLPPRPPFLTPDQLPFPSPEEGLLTPDGLLRPDVRRPLVGAPMQSTGELSLRDDVDYTRPVVARMFTSTTLGTTSRDSLSSGRPSVYSEASADHAAGPTAYDDALAVAATHVPPVVVEGEEPSGRATPHGRRSPSEVDPMLPEAL